MKKIILLISLLQVNFFNSINPKVFNVQAPIYHSPFFKNRNINNNFLVPLNTRDIYTHKVNFKDSVLLNRKKVNKDTKNILIFTSTGGGGHTAVANALNGYLANSNYNITVVNFFEDVMGSLDDVKTFTFGKLSSEDFYNFCLKYRFIRLVNIFTRFGGWVLNSKYDAIEKEAYNFINRFTPKPDLIISVIPMVNNVILSAAKKIDIPFLVVTNDLDTINYINGISQINYKKFYYTLPFKDQDIIQKIYPANIPKGQVIFSGFPLRPDFFNKKRDKDTVYKNFNIPKNKNKIMILMGGSGSYATYKYTKALCEYKKPIHIIACLGRDQNTAKLIDEIELPKHITLSKIGFTDKIADLMSISQVIITKSGPGSICEAIASNLPMIIDKTNEIIRWENLNIEFVKKYRLGSVLCDIKDLNKKLDKLLNNAQYRRNIKNNINRLNSKITFANNIKTIVDKIITT